MTKRLETILPEGWPRPKGYANGILVPPGRSILFVAGQIGWNEREEIVSPEFTAQFEQALDNVLAVVRAAGGDAADVARLTVYVADRNAYLSALRPLGRAYRERFGDHYPAMALVEIAALVEPGALVEIEATAAIEPSSPEPRPRTETP